MEKAVRYISVGCTALFILLVLFASSALDDLGSAVVFGFLTVLLLLWFLERKLDRMEKKLDELLKKRDEHDKQ